MSPEYWQEQFEAWLAQHAPEDDKAHDIAHFRRVWRTARQIMQTCPADALVVLAACYFHDIVNLPKNHPQRAQASAMAAQETLRILRNDFPSFPSTLHEAVAHAVQAHSFSAGVTPLTPEARIVQDADRLESLGAIGLARVFYVSGALGRALFDGDDPLAEQRPLDDSTYALDHFQQKLLTLPDTMQTAPGRRLAQQNARFLVQYMARLCAELKGDYSAPDPDVLARFMR